MTTAVVVVDVQRGLVDGEAAVPDADTFVAGLTAFLERARSRGVPIVHLQDDGSAPESPLRRGTEGWDLALAVPSGDRILSKADDDGFRGTDLHDTLQAWGADRLVVVGIQSEMCVAATARGALDRGYAVVVPREGHTTYDIPADDEGGPAVPAALVARVAEWSLGDTVEVPRTLDEVAWDHSWPSSMNFRSPGWKFSLGWTGPRSGADEEPLARVEVHRQVVRDACGAAGPGRCPPRGRGPSYGPARRRPRCGPR